MAHLFLGIFLIVFGLNILVGLGLPSWVTGLLALITGALILFERSGRGTVRK